jgi:Glycosyltransferase family 87
MVSDAALRRVLSPSTVALLGDLIRALLWGLAIVIWISFAQVYLRMIRLTLADPSSSDFTIFYYTARMVADALPMYGESPARYGVTWAAGHLGNLNPPHFMILFVPLAGLPYGQALLAWVAISFACLAASLVVIFRELRVPFTWTRFVSWGAFTIGLAPFTTVAVTSEMTFVLMLPFALLWRAWRRAQWAHAGLWLGVLVSLKLFFLVLVGWLALQRQWRALGACAAATVVLVLLGGGVFGFDAYRLWTGSLGTVGWQWMAMNASWPGFASRVLQGGATIQPATMMPWLVQPMAVFGAAFVLAVTLRSTWRGPDDVRWREWALLVLLLGAILASPLGWVYYLPLAYAPVLGWMGAGEGWARVKKLSRPALAVFVIAVALLYTPQEVANAGQPWTLATLTLATAYFYATALLWLTLIRERGRPN